MTVAFLLFKGSKVSHVQWTVEMKQGIRNKYMQFNLRQSIFCNFFMLNKHNMHLKKLYSLINSYKLKVSTILFQNDFFWYYHYQNLFYFENNLVLLIFFMQCSLVFIYRFSWSVSNSSEIKEMKQLNETLSFYVASMQISVASL